MCEQTFYTENLNLDWYMCKVNTHTIINSYYILLMHVSLKSLNSYAWSPGCPCFRQPKSFPAPSAACVPITNNKNTAMLIKNFLQLLTYKSKISNRNNPTPSMSQVKLGLNSLCQKWHICNMFRHERKKILLLSNCFNTVYVYR